VPELAYGSAAEIRRGVMEMLRPPQETTVAESAAKNLKIVNPSGGSGNWSPETAPYMIEPMNLARSRLYDGVVFMGPARSGKTVALVDAVLAYSIVDDPADCMVVQTSQREAEDFSKMRIRRAIHGSPELASRLSPRSHDDNVLLKMFRSGMAIRFGWPSIGVLSGKDLRRMLLPDADNYTGDMTIDEAWGAALKRTQTYMSAGICIAESSPARDYADGKWRPSSPHEAPPATGIASLYNSGDRRLWYWPCPDCKDPFAATAGLGLFALPDDEELRERVVVDDVLTLAERYSRVVCPHCGTAIDPKHKRAMNAAGRWVAEGQRMWPDGTITGEARRTRVASHWLGGVAAAYQPWVSMLERYFQALKMHVTTSESKPLKTTTNVDQAMPFLPPAVNARRDGHELQDRAEEAVQGFVPRGVRFLTAQVDVQAGKRAGFEVLVTGWGPQREKWWVDRFGLRTSEREQNGELLPLDPSAYVEDWHRLIQKTIDRRYPLADGSGRTMPIRVVLCDSGGKGGKDGDAGVTARAYEFWRELKRAGLGHRFRLVKGGSSANAPRVHEAYPDTRARKDRNSGSAGDVPVLLLNTDALKDVLAADLRREDPGPGYLHVPAWASSSVLDELTAETRTAKGWVAMGRKHNETLDLSIYGEAAWIALQADKITWELPPPWARDWDENPDVRKEDVPDPPKPAAPRQPRVVRSNYLRR
jgi:phage terminase large subunit GpA-like protein